MPTPDDLALARPWRGVADHLGDAGVPFAHPLLSVWRELAWCHLPGMRPEVGITSPMRPCRTVRVGRSGAP